MASKSKASFLYAVNQFYKRQQQVATNNAITAKRFAIQQSESTPKAPPVSASNTPTPQQFVYCFIFDRTRCLISLANAYQSTVDSRQRLSYPHLYIHASSLDHAIEKINLANKQVRDTIGPMDSEHEKQETLTAIMRHFNGYVHTDDIDPAIPPPQKNITAIARKRSKKSPAKHQQLSALIRDEETKRSNTPYAATELDRCKREHRPIVYVPPQPIDCIDKWQGSIRLSVLAKELAQLALSVASLPPLEQDTIESDTIEHSEQAIAYAAHLRRQEKLAEEQRRYEMECEREAKYFSIDSP